MLPNLYLNFLLFDWQIKSYNLFFFLAILIAISGSLIFAWKRGFNKKTTAITIIVIALAMLVGSRLLYTLTNYTEFLNEPLKIFSFHWVYFSLFGGLILALFAGIFCCSIFKIDLWRFADTLCPFGGLGIALARIGCFLNGCCFGKTTSLPWGVKFPLLSQAHLYQITHGQTDLLTVLPVHPTQLYEAIAALVGSGLAFYLIKKKYQDGLTITLVTIWFIIFRFFNHLLRALINQPQEPVYFYPLLYLLLLTIALIILNLRRNKKLFTTNK